MSNYYRLDLAKKKIVLNRSVYKMVSRNPECDAAAEVLALLDKFPGFSFAPRTCAPAHDKNTFEGLNVSVIKRYIKAVDPESNNYDMVCDMERRLSTKNLKEGGTRATFPQIRAWFFEQYPEALKLGTSGIKYVTLITEVEQKVADENAKVLQMPAPIDHEVKEEKMAANH